MAETNIYEKLRKVQLELKAPKSQRNNFGNYNYRNVEDILEAAKPILDKHGLTLVVSDRIKNIGERYYIEATATLVAYPTGIQENTATDSDEDNRPWVPRGISVTAYAREEETKKGMDGAQITGAASSYARKYALNGLLAIDDTKDADSNEHTAQTSSAAPKPALKPATQLQAPDPNKMSLAQLRKMQAMFSEFGITSSEERHRYVAETVGREVAKTSDLTKQEAVKVLDRLDEDLFALGQKPA